MNDGFTGLSVAQAQNDMDAYAVKAFSNRHNYWLAFNYLFEELSQVWASPKAVDFDRIYRPIIADNLANFDYTIAKNYTDARDAYNFLARANGVPTIGSDSMYLIDSNGNHAQGLEVDSFPKLLDNINGIVGINDEQAKIIMSSFESKIKAALEETDEIPMDIALYDPYGNLKKSFVNRVSFLKQLVTVLMKDMTRKVEIAIEQEAHSVLLAKQQATESLSE